MTTYKVLKGTNIQAVSSDPSNPIEGQVWYNTTSNVTKGQSASTVGSWSSGGNVNTARVNVGASGTKSAALLFGGNTPPNTAKTESYDGTSWTEVNDLNTARRALGGSGSQTAALAFGGVDPSPANTGATELWGGTNWTEVNDMNNAR